MRVNRAADHSCGIYEACLQGQQLQETTGIHELVPQEQKGVVHPIPHASRPIEIVLGCTAIANRIELVKPIEENDVGGLQLHDFVQETAEHIRVSCARL